MRSRVPFALLLAGGLASCVRFEWTRYQVQEPIPVEESTALTPGVDTLESCIARLGAPLYVWEASASTYALAYGWDEGHDWGFNVSVPVGDTASASFDYGDMNLDLHGVVLVFDHGDRLVRSDRGYLRDLAPGLQRRRPSLIDDEDEEPGGESGS